MADTLPELLSRLGQSLADFVIFIVHVRDSPLWQGRLMTVLLEAGDSAVVVEHALGRAHRGAFVVTATYPIGLHARAATDPRTVRFDVETVPAMDISYGVWVF